MEGKVIMDIILELFAKGDDVSLHVYKDQEWGNERYTICMWEKNKTMTGDPDKVISLSRDAAETLGVMVLKIIEENE